MKYYYYHDVDFRGRVERVEYETTNQDGVKCGKYANVYLPYGYDSNDFSTRYDILYLMHGGGGNADAWLDCCLVKNMLDYVICTQKVKPLIVVFPTFYKQIPARKGQPDANYERENVLSFQNELVEDLIPAVECRFHTYAEHITVESLQASRNHRAFGGFSMGGATTWFVLSHCPQYFSRFVPLSGDCWEITPLGGRFNTKETALFLHDFIRDSTFSPDEFHIFAATGTKDAANNALTPQIENMKAMPDIFNYSDDYSKGNLHFLLADGEEHSYQAVYQYLYNFIPYLFV